MTKIYGTCVPGLLDEVTPGWVWRDEEDELLDAAKFNSSHLPPCGECITGYLKYACYVSHFNHLMMLSLRQSLCRLSEMVRMSQGLGDHKKFIQGLSASLITN